MDTSSRLLLLLEVVELGSFVKVAEQRNVDRSVISKQISRLEEELDVRLLNRTTRSLSLTAAGNEMVNQAHQLRALLNDTQRLAQNYHSEPRGLLRITSSTMFGRQYVQQAISVFQKQYPDVDFELRLEDRIVDMVKEGFDIGFRIGKPKNSSLISRKIARSRLLIVASPEFIEKHGAINTIEKLESLPATIYAAPGLLINQFSYVDQQGKAQHFQLNATYKVNDVEMIPKSVVAGSTLAVVTAQMLTDEITSGQLVPIMTHLQLDDFGTFYAVYPHRDAPIKTKLFLDTLKSIVGEYVPIWEQNIPGFESMYGNTFAKI
ncbi:LysR family transcriptional regulator [Vibrio crassostreae]|uniref:Similar to transcriptional regulator, LysR family n=1 Tax=Vibrio crassostreae TaxID=246167 RepID=A0ABM9QMP1_9VIBR|nr:LysR family transcriptional regulator [Vibrio crassostreae]ROO76252.1 LysR family transcriptional regulator [Vibrio crassostreae]ROP14262.1 LysR family transcriptional regulator [Vibrio crassostreae]ROP24198.1 LysR family transcriptional regulator [Vibrio crassostreae]ROP24632.1 LysR family transcriptional regulator [Vibrio crassostreae]ROQ88348.1 LysR family transcriptional regulator [Vibrio crassostreae]